MRCEGAIYPALSGFQLRCGARQSMPSSSIASCAAVRAILPSFAAGHTNRPFSRRFENRHAPCPSHQMILIKSPRRPRKTNMWPVNGSCFSVCSACAASVVNPRRMSVTPAASQTRVFAGTGITPTCHGSAAPAPRDRSLRRSAAGGRPRRRSRSSRERPSDLPPLPPDAPRSVADRRSLPAGSSGHPARAPRPPVQPRGRSEGRAAM